MTHDGSSLKAPNKLIHALPLGLADEPPKDTLEEFKEWFPKGLLKKTLPSKRPPRYTAKHDTLDKPHDLGCMQHIDVAFYYLRKKIRQFPELEQRKVTTVDTFFPAKVRSLWTVYQSAPDKFNWGCCDSIFRIMLGVRVQSGASWFDVNTVLMPIHFGDLKHWALVKLELTNWTIEFKLRDPPGNYPIPVTIMKDIPQQANGGDCGMFTIKYAECLIEGRDVRYWVIDARMQIFREWLACYLWAYSKRKLDQTYKSDEDEETDF
ncbi:hypothetical protein TIFTF001_024830 [Ficus carica]|uniref:Ubiquitin-like protease family profile domain-containing protein n=1 Tax=Ficus carica TaxID=3494 RepID=A0AA88ALZ4_FICCA|nr:hypothetical protein TIFTF001_024830 [Ficus carica]